MLLFTRLNGGYLPPTVPRNTYVSQARFHWFSVDFPGPQTCYAATMGRLLARFADDLWSVVSSQWVDNPTGWGQFPDPKKKLPNKNLPGFFEALWGVVFFGLAPKQHNVRLSPAHRKASVHWWPRYWGSWWRWLPATSNLRRRARTPGFNVRKLTSSLKRVV